MRKYHWYYAQLNSNNVCCAISDFPAPVTDESFLSSVIELEYYDVSLIGKIYNNGVWENAPQEESEPSQLDRIEEQLNKNYAQAQQEAVDAYTLELMEGGII